MIVKHAEKSLLFHDGEREHHIDHADFDFMRPADKGGIHPGFTEEYQGYLTFEQGLDASTCPVTPVVVEQPDFMRPGKTMKITYLPIKVYLQARYGPDGHIVSIPINGEANAQRLHWIKRNKKEQAEMKALLKWMNAWRLREDGTVPDEGEYVVSGIHDPRSPAIEEGAS